MVPDWRQSTTVPGGLRLLPHRLELTSDRARSYVCAESRVGGSESSNARQEVCAGTTICARRPSDKLGPRSEQHEDSFVTCRTSHEAAVRAETRARRGVKGRCRCHETTSAVRSKPPGLVLTRWVRAEPTQQHVPREHWDRSRGPRKADRPDRARNSREIGGVDNAFVAKKLRPRAVRGFRQVLSGPFAISMPPSLRLGHRLPKEWESRVRVTKDDHVPAPAPTSAAARRRTSSTGLDCGSHSPRSRSLGACASSCALGRSNHRRIPNSL